MALPHITNSTAGVNLYDPVHKSIFEVSMELPAGINFADTSLLTQHVLTVSGLEALYRAPEVDSQKFMGVDRSFLKPTIGETKASIEIEFSLNLNENNDNYILNVFRAWAALGHNIATGSRSRKTDYAAPWLKIRIANRAGDVYQEIIFKDVMLNGPLETDGGLDYTADDALQLKVKFVSDWWKEQVVGYNPETGQLG
jgi:hypothetical protein